MNVLHVLPIDGLGGAEIAARSAAGRDGLTVHFLTRRAGFAAAALQPGVSMSAATFALSLVSLRDFLRVRASHVPAIVIFSLWRSLPAFLVHKMRSTGARTILMLHSAMDAHIVDRLCRSVMERLSDEIWTDSQATVERVSKSQRYKVRTISFVLHKPEPPRAHPPSPTLIFWGRIHHDKGLDRTIALLAELRRREHAFTLDIYGPDAGHKGELSALAAKLGVADAIQWHAPVDWPHIVAAASRASFFVQLSRIEGMAMSAVEAMQLGLVPVLTPIGGMAEYGHGGDNAIIYETQDQAASEIIACLSDLAHYERLRDRARSTFEHCETYAESVMNHARAAVS